MFSDYKYIISKYFSIFRNIKQIKYSFVLSINEKKKKIMIFREKIQKIIMLKIFFSLKKRKENKLLTIEKEKKLKKIKEKCLINYSFNVWRQIFKDVLKKKASLIKINDCFARISKKHITENFIYLKNYKQWYKKILFPESHRYEIANEEKKENKSEFEIRLEIKYKNLEKLIMKYENLKSISLSFNEYNGKKNNFQDHNLIQQELSILKNMIKIQMKEIEDLKIQLL